MCIRDRPGMMKGYYKDEEATRRAIIDGWYYTADLGKVDEKGYLYIMGRKDEMIISGAENIYPLPIEKVLNEHPKVLEAAVIGIPDKEWGEIVLALIVPQSGEKPEPEELINYCRDKLGSHMKPRRIEFVESLPKTETGKIYKPALRKKYASGNINDI